MDIDATLAKAREEQARDKKLILRRLLFAVLIFVSVVAVIPKDIESFNRICDCFITPYLPGENPYDKQHARTSLIIVHAIAILAAIVCISVLSLAGLLIAQALSVFRRDRTDRGFLLRYIDLLKKRAQRFPTAENTLDDSTSVPLADDTDKEAWQNEFDLITTKVEKSKRMKKWHVGSFIIFLLLWVTFTGFAIYLYRKSCPFMHDMLTLLQTEKDPIQIEEMIRSATQVIFIIVHKLAMITVSSFQSVVFSAWSLIRIYRKDVYRDLLYDLVGLEEKEQVTDETTDSIAQSPIPLAE